MGFRPHALSLVVETRDLGGREGNNDDLCVESICRLDALRSLLRPLLGQSATKIVNQMRNAYRHTTGYAKLMQNLSNHCLQ